LTKLKFDHIPAFFADDMVMVILQFTEFIFYGGSIHDLEDDPQRFKKTEGPIDGREPDLSLFFEQQLK
jgi:hypothetical protein